MTDNHNPDLPQKAVIQVYNEEDVNTPSTRVTAAKLADRGFKVGLVTKSNPKGLNGDLDILGDLYVPAIDFVDIKFNIKSVN